jgi:hypothetical protein
MQKTEKSCCAYKQVRNYKNPNFLEISFQKWLEETEKNYRKLKKRFVKDGKKI